MGSARVESSATTCDIVLRVASNTGLMFTFTRWGTAVGSEPSYVVLRQPGSWGKGGCTHIGALKRSKQPAG